MSKQQTNNIHTKRGREERGERERENEDLIVLILAINLAPDSATNPFFLLLK